MNREKKNVDAFLTCVCKFLDSCQCVIIVTRDFYPVYEICILYVTEMSVVRWRVGRTLKRANMLYCSQPQTSKIADQQ